MCAVVLAAGRGTRMRPLTDRRPKPLLPVGDRSLLERVFDTAIDVIDEFVVVTGYCGEAIRESIGDAYRDHPVHHVEQAEAMGTAHAVAQAKPVDDIPGRYADRRSTRTLSDRRSTDQPRTAGLPNIDPVTPAC